MLPTVGHTFKHSHIMRYLKTLQNGKGSCATISRLYWTTIHVHLNQLNSTQYAYYWNLGINSYMKSLHTVIILVAYNFTFKPISFRLCRGRFVL